MYVKVMGHDIVVVSFCFIVWFTCSHVKLCKHMLLLRLHEYGAHLVHT